PLTPHRARVADLRIKWPLPRLARLPRLTRHEAKIACAERRAITRDRRNVVARFEGLVLNLQPCAGNRRDSTFWRRAATSMARSSIDATMSTDRQFANPT